MLILRFKGIYFNLFQGDLAFAVPDRVIHEQINKTNFFPDKNGKKSFEILRQRDIV